MRACYFDTAFVVKCYVREVGADQVRALADSADELLTSDLARAEFAAALHRKLREGWLSNTEAAAVIAQFAADCRDRIWAFVPLTSEVLERVSVAFVSLPNALPLRAADAIHCASAVERGLDRIYSNDRHLLGAASHFGLEAVDVTAA